MDQLLPRAMVLGPFERDVLHILEPSKPPPVVPETYWAQPVRGAWLDGRVRPPLSAMPGTVSHPFDGRIHASFQLGLFRMIEPCPTWPFRDTRRCQWEVSEIPSLPFRLLPRVGECVSAAIRCGYTHVCVLVIKTYILKSLPFSPFLVCN